MLGPFKAVLYHVVAGHEAALSDLEDTLKDTVQEDRKWSVQCTNIPQVEVNYM